jgi:hypothetical protein
MPYFCPAETAAILGNRLSHKATGVHDHPPQRSVEEKVRIGTNQALRQIKLLREQKLVIGVGPETLVGSRPHICRRNDRQGDQRRYGLRVIERQPIADPGAAIVSYDGKFFEAEPLHDGELVGRHRSFRIGAMMLIGLRRAGIAIAAQIGRDDGEILGERRGNTMPGNMSFGIAV